MAFVASQNGKTFIVAGGPAPVTVNVPQMVDLSGNGFSPNAAFSHYMVVAAGSTGGGANATFNASSGITFPVPPSATTITVNSIAASDVYVAFGKMF